MCPRAPGLYAPVKNTFFIDHLRWLLLKWLLAQILAFTILLLLNDKSLLTNYL